MTTPSRKPEIILIRESLGTSLLRDAGIVVTFVALIGIGVVLDSAAIQWVGAVIGFIVIGARAKAATRRLSVAEARERLDEIERGEGV